MNVEEYKRKINPPAEIGQEEAFRISLEEAYAILHNAFDDDDITKKGYMIIHGNVMRIKADYEREARQEEVFIQPKEEVDLLELLIASMWKSIYFIEKFPDGTISDVDTEKVEKWLKERLANKDF